MCQTYAGRLGMSTGSAPTGDNGCVTVAAVAPEGFTGFGCVENSELDRMPAFEFHEPAAPTDLGCFSRHQGHPYLAQERV
jgi:hypothetical protein